MSCGWHGSFPNLAISLTCLTKGKTMPPVREKGAVAAPYVCRFEPLEERMAMSSTPLNPVPVILPTVVASVPDPGAFGAVVNAVNSWLDPESSGLRVGGITPRPQSPELVLKSIFHQAPTFALVGAFSGVENPLVNAPTAGLKFTSFANGQWWSDVSIVPRAPLGNIPNLADVIPNQFSVFGVNIDRAAAGDWNGDGVDQLGVFRKGMWYLDWNGNNRWDSFDRGFSFGSPGDLPAVGDWSGRGRDAIGVFRNGWWYLDWNANGVWDAGDRSLQFGAKGDIPVVGDWNGDGRDQIGVVRGNRWFLDTNSLLGYQGNDFSFVFGPIGGVPVSADFDGDGRTDIGVYNNGRWLIDLGIASRRSYVPLTLDFNVGPNSAQIFPMIGRGPGIYDVARRVSLFAPYRFGYAELSPSTSAAPPLPAGVSYPTFPRPIYLPAGTAPPGRIATLPNPSFPINQQPSPLGPMQLTSAKPIISSGTLSQIRPSNDQTSLPGDPRAIERSRPQSSGGGIPGIDAGNEIWILDAGQRGGESQGRADVIDRVLENVEQPWLA
jgi:hypothetical protein